MNAWCVIMTKKVTCKLCERTLKVALALSHLMEHDELIDWSDAS